jgi:hypothetical protein
MTIADKAVDAAIHCEMKKVAYRQTKDGIVISFVLHPQEVPAELSTSHIGARYIAALVEIGDDEMPINPAEKEIIPTHPAPARLQSDSPSAGAKQAKREWRDVQPAAQSGIRCNEPTFCAFLNETRQYRITGADEAAQAVREICGVNSRVEFSTKHAARTMWHQLDTEYQAWMARERVGA